MDPLRDAIKVQEAKPETYQNCISLMHFLNSLESIN